MRPADLDPRDLRDARRGSCPRRATRWRQLAAVLALSAAACAGEITGHGGRPADDGPGVGDDDGGGAEDDEPDDGDQGGDPVPVEIPGGPVAENAQAFADAACGALGACNPATYDGHHPDSAHALDTMMAELGVDPVDDGPGDAHAAFALEHQDEYAIWYVIWKQRINYGNGWEPMEDRGSITQNHYDHVHVSFY